jgi:hypothetical protein
MNRENETAMKLMKLRIATVLGLLLLMATMMLRATPVFAQELRHVAEVLKTTSNGTVSFGPVSPTCSATDHTGCKFVDASGGTGIGKIVEGDDAGATFTFTQDTTLLLASTPSGAHDPNGVSTGVCLPLFGQDHWVFEDGSTIDLNRQGSECCAASDCSGRVGPPFLTHIATIITGGTGSFAGLKGAAKGQALLAD